jgi:predicted ester cyclase
MSEAENKLLVQAYFDNAWNKVRDSPGYEYWSKEGAEFDHYVWIPMWRKALSDMRMAVDAMYAEGTFVTVCMPCSVMQTGVVEGDLIRQGIISQSLPPTGNKVEFSAIIVYEIENGILKRAVHGVIDWLTGLRQMGALPAPA